MYIVYGLVDPRNNVTRYVGMTDNVYKRFQQHMYCDGSNPRKDGWIGELKALNKMLVMVTLEEVETLYKATEKPIGSTITLS
jgi:predicted GIY-YIG superfamily endonuclease